MFLQTIFFKRNMTRRFWLKVPPILFSTRELLSFDLFRSYPLLIKNEEKR